MDDQASANGEPQRASRGPVVICSRASTLHFTPFRDWRNEQALPGVPELRPNEEEFKVKTRTRVILSQETKPMGRSQGGVAVKTETEFQETEFQESLSAPAHEATLILGPIRTLTTCIPGPQGCSCR